MAPWPSFHVWRPLTASWATLPMRFRMPASRLRIVPTSCAPIAMGSPSILVSSLACASGIPTSRACCVSGVRPWTMSLPCATAHKSCFRWSMMAMNRSKRRVRHLGAPSASCSLLPGHLSALAIRRPRASATRWAARWLAWRWVVPSSSGSRVIFPVLSGRPLVLRATSCYTAAVPA